MDRCARRRLRSALLETAPWLAATEVGPQAVEAGRCDACDESPRLLPTCGPAGPGAVCRDCAVRLGVDGWCEGHQEEGAAALVWAASLPASWAELVILWWVATGEVRPTAWSELDTSVLPLDVRRSLPLS
ncbi:MAG: hypothetical protein EA387_14775 [Nitriliruptor sp.]|nr:MAG: hypothetical protein EA387_14775 [Nitriliruptor sp.]